jgi:hypothetical protein
VIGWEKVSPTVERCLACEAVVSRGGLTCYFSSCSALLLINWDR